MNSLRILISEGEYIIIVNYYTQPSLARGKISYIKAHAASATISRRDVDYKLLNKMRGSGVEGHVGNTSPSRQDQA